METMLLLAFLFLLQTSDGSIGPSFNVTSPCGEQNVIFVESSFPVSEIQDCQALCKVAKSCEFFTFNKGTGNCGIRTYSPKAYINASPNGRVGTKTDILSPTLDGKVFVGDALNISGGNSLDCQRSCQHDENCISWTWNEKGGSNSEICVHNYGNTQRKLSVRGSKIISGPKCCPVSCDDIVLNQLNSSGVFANIYPHGVPKNVSCDVVTDVESCVPGKRPWTVIQRRGQFSNPKDFFSSKLWDDYVEGFGDPSKELWLGLKYVTAITETGKWELRVDLEDYEGKQYSAIYSSFRISGDKYRLEISGYDEVRSSIKDSLSYSNGAAFSTSDNDNDGYHFKNCAEAGAWWYKYQCSRSNLNGNNFFQSKATNGQGITWKNEDNERNQNYYFSWPKVEMKIRKKRMSV